MSEVHSPSTFSEIMARLTDNRFKKAFAMVELPRWMTILALSFGILAMTTLTVMDLYPIVADYCDDNENSQVQIKVRRADEEFQAPDLHLCIPLGPRALNNFSSELVDYLEHGKECPMCEGMANHTFDVWNHLSMRPNESIIALYEAYQEELRKLVPHASPLLGNVPSDVTNMLQKAFVQRFLELENDTTRNGDHRNQMFMRAKNNGVNMGNISWNRPIVNSIVEYLMLHSFREKSLLFQTRFQGHPSADDKPTDPPIFKSSLDALYSTLTMFVCESLWVINGTSITDQNVCNDFIGNASLVLSESFSPFFCMRIPLDYVQELNILMVSQYFEKYMGSRRKFLILTENPTYPPKTSPLPTSHLYVSPESDLSLRSMEEVTISYSIQSKVIEARPGKLKSCYVESSKSECELQCYVDQLESICKCRSYAFRSRSLSRMNFEGLENRGKYCTDADFRTCPQRIANNTGRDICTGKCADACQSTAYQWQVSSTTRSNYGQSLKLSIQNRQQSYLEFMMRVKVSSPDLTSKIGGVCNIYLGLNGLSVIFFVIYAYESTRRWLRLWRKEEKEEDGTGVQERRSSKVAWPWSHRVAVSTEDRLDKMEKHLVELSAAFREFQESNRKNEM